MTKLYDYTNPKRFWKEPLQKYSLSCTWISLLILAIMAGLSHFKEVDSFLISNSFLVVIVITVTLISAIQYTILYYARGWGNWN